jgi:hypothetical protein
MHLLITPRRSMGATLRALPVKRTNVIRGDLVIRNEVCEALHRHSNVARVTEIYGDRRPLLREMYDATISAMATEGFTLSGIEFDGERWYAQSWWCRPIRQDT